MLRQPVADASAIVEYLLRTRSALSIEQIIQDPDVDVHVPSLCDVEVLSGLRRALLEGQMTLELRENFTAYDAVYVALAERLRSALLSGDLRLRRAARGHTSLEVLPSSL